MIMISQRKKLLIVTDYFYPHWTGIAKSFSFTIEYLRDVYDFTILTVRHLDKLKSDESYFSARIKRYQTLFSFSRSKYSISLLVGFVNEIKTHKVIIINSPCVNILPLSLLSKLFSKKLIIYHQGDLILPDGIGNKIIERIFDVSTIIAFQLADCISTNTRDYAANSRVMKYFLNKFTPLLLPVVKKKIKKTRLPDLQELKKSKKILIGFGGRFVREKGFDILFDAIPLIVKKMPQVYFVFAGETTMKYEDFYEQNIEKINKIKTFIVFLGLLKEDDLRSLYSYLDFLVVPSRSDCFPLMQAEAMMHGVPSIVSNIPGARYLVKKTKFGVTFKNGDAKDLAKKIVFAINNKNKINSFYPKVEEVLNNDRNSQKIIDVIEYLYDS